MRVISENEEIVERMAGKLPGNTHFLACHSENRTLFVTVVSNCSKETPMSVTRGKILEISTIHTDGWSAYDEVIVDGYDHYRVYHSQNEFAR